MASEEWEKGKEGRRAKEKKEGNNDTPISDSEFLYRHDLTTYDERLDAIPSHHGTALADYGHDTPYAKSPWYIQPPAAKNITYH